jgi:hypothetical protein
MALALAVGPELVEGLLHFAPDRASTKKGEPSFK